MYSASALLLSARSLVILFAVYFDKEPWSVFVSVSLMLLNKYGVRF